MLLITNILIFFVLIFHRVINGLRRYVKIKKKKIIIEVPKRI